MNRHVLSILLENEPGALSRVVGLFSARGYNIESLTVAPTEDPTEDPTVSRADDGHTGNRLVLCRANCQTLQIV